MSNRFRGFVYLLLALFLFPLPVNAQSTVRVVLDAPNTDSFPQIEAYLDVHDAEGKFLHGLQASQVRILEDGAPEPVTEINQLRPGVQVVFALNPDPPLGLRDSKGFSRYDYIKDTIRAWAKSRLGSTLDDLSLLITDSVSLSHVSDPQIFLAALETDQIDPRDATASLDTLFRAVNTAADASPRPSMGRAVIFITPPLEGELEQSLENIVSQANQQDVSIFIIAVSTIEDFPTRGVQRLMDLSSQTGGELFAYSGEETLPNPEDFLAHLRHIYRVSYSSNIASSGPHSLAVQVQLGVEQIESNLQNIEIIIQPPVPAFISPPIQIHRIPPSETADDEQVPPDRYLPGEQSLQIVYDFPDGRKRPLVMTALFVDGELVSENNQPPFDMFSWSLNQYHEDGTHLIQVQAKDSFGLVGNSIELPVFVSVAKPKLDPWAALRRNLPAITILTVVLSGAVLLLVLVLGGRIRPRALRTVRRKRKTDPVTQPVPVKEEKSARSLPSWINRLQWSQRITAPQALAFLHCVSDSEDTSKEPPIPITTDETVIGSDPNQATIVLPDQSIEGLHARMVCDKEGSFVLADEGSVAGTWVNYSPVKKGGVLLVHGDLIHFGRLGFRFTLRKPTQVRKPMISPLHDIQETLEEISP
jgi:hypothetical protein